ncbi:Ras family protein [Histomonas meleagridis]|uniref:Ras family protein n=1 Tax=Histomonas meleagridis TaxID=135588 RepID=UPI00355AB1E1|nr:Ras family protein [Histomonas meleagridis]KAH0806651.1 Ras family protein [Histomonas meleagridis]
MNSLDLIVHNIIILGSDFTGKRSLKHALGCHGLCLSAPRETELEVHFSLEVDGVTHPIVVDYSRDIRKKDGEIAWTLFPFEYGYSGIMIIYSIEDLETFKTVEKRCQSIREYYGYDVPIIVIGNKIDLEETRCVSTEEGEKLAQKFGADFIEISIKNFQNVKEAYIILVRKIREYAKNIIVQKELKHQQNKEKANIIKFV